MVSSSVSLVFLLNKMTASRPSYGPREYMLSAVLLKILPRYDSVTTCRLIQHSDDIFLFILLVAVIMIKHPHIFTIYSGQIPFFNVFSLTYHAPIQPVVSMPALKFLVGMQYLYAQIPLRPVQTSLRCQARVLLCSPPDLLTALLSCRDS